jgi:ABC-2 type transport system permease protein
MRLSKSWIVASKDLRVFRLRKSILYSVVAFPLIVAIGLPLVIPFAGAKTGGIPVGILPGILNSFAFFFILGAASLPTAIASYCLVGEKVDKSLEPLLATPTTDSEILFGKGLAAFLPPLASTYLGAAVFMALVDRFTYGRLGYLYFPNWTIGIILLVVTPLTCLLSVEVSILVSSRASDVRAAQQTSGLMVLPFGAIYVASEIGVVPLSTVNLEVISVILLALDVSLFFVSRAIFQREEILTKWK